MVKDDIVSFDLKVITAAYAMACSQPFMPFIYDCKTYKVHYVCLQDLYISDPELIERIANNKATVRISFSALNTVERDCHKLEPLCNPFPSPESSSHLRLP